jgi:hypothetical protein
MARDDSGTSLTGAAPVSVTGLASGSPPAGADRSDATSASGV